MNFSMYSCIHFLSIGKPNTMSKRAQARKTGEEPVAGGKIQASEFDIKKFDRESISHVGFGYNIQSGEWQNWVGILISQALRKSGRDRNEISASISHVWQRDDNPFPSTERSGREVNQRSSTGKRRREVENQLTEVKLNHHNLEIPNTRHIEEVSANVRQKWNRPEDDQMVPDPKVNVLECSLFVSTTMKAAIHLGENYKDNLFIHRNTDFEALKPLFDITQKLILEQKHETKHVS